MKFNKQMYFMMNFTCKKIQNININAFYSGCPFA